MADDLRDQITSGHLAPGEKLPSEREIARTYEAARNTAREALRLLADEGLVTARHGSGVYVRAPYRLIRLSSDRYSHRHRATGRTPFRLECARQGKIAHIRVVGITREIPPPEVAEHLGIAIDQAEVLHRENHYFADDDPVQVVSTYLRFAEAEGTPLTQSKTGPGGIYGRLEDLGHTMTRYTEDATARMPTPSEAAVLRLLPGVPVLDILHTSYDQDDTPFEVSRFVHRGDLSGVRYEHRIDE